MLHRGINNTIALQSTVLFNHEYSLYTSWLYSLYRDFFLQMSSAERRREEMRDRLEERRREQQERREEEEREREEAEREENERIEGE